MRNPVTNKSKSPAKHRESKNGNLNAKNSSQVAAQLAASQIDWDKIPVAASTPRKSSLGSTSSSTRDSSHESLPSTSTGRKRSISDRLNWKKPTSTKKKPMRNVPDTMSSDWKKVFHRGLQMRKNILTSNYPESPQSQGGLKFAKQISPLLHCYKWIISVWMTSN